MSCVASCGIWMPGLDAGAGSSSLWIPARGTVPPAARMHQTELLSCLLAAKVVLRWLMVGNRNIWETGAVVTDSGQTFKKKVFSVDQCSQKYWILFWRCLDFCDLKLALKTSMKKKGVLCLCYFLGQNQPLLVNSHKICFGSYNIHSYRVSYKGPRRWG